MKEKGSIRVNLAVVICLIIILILLGLCMFIFYWGLGQKQQVADNLNKRNTQESQNVEIVNEVKTEIKNTTRDNKEAEKTTIANKNSEKIDEGKDWIYSENMKYGKVPQININSETARIFNEEIKMSIINLKIINEKVLMDHTNINNILTEIIFLLL